MTMAAYMDMLSLLLTHISSSFVFKIVNMQWIKEDWETQAKAKAQPKAQAKTKTCHGRGRRLRGN